jgi:hypothetical protein
MQNLDEVKQLISDARDIAQGRRSGQEMQDMQMLAKLQLAAQGDALLERVQAARALYEDLRKTLAREKALSGR